MHNAIKSFKTGAFQGMQKLLACCKSRYTICLNVQVYVVYTTEKVKMISFYYFNSIFLCTSLLKLREECQFDRFFLKRDM